MNFLYETIYNNTVKEWLIAIGIFALSMVLLRILKAIFVRRLNVLAQKTSTDLDNLLLDLIKKTKSFFLLAVAIYAGSFTLTLPAEVSNIIQILFLIACLVQAAIWGDGIIDFFLQRYKKEKLDKDAAGVTTITAIGFLAKIALWVVILLLALDNMGVNITGLVAGLGIGGVAIALAVQNVLGDLFASMSIVLDKPFVIGDFIIVDDYLGTVQHIGLKTTRIQSLSGEQLIFSNSDLLGSRIRNYKRMYERRIVFAIGVTYQTPYDKLKAIPPIIREIIEKQENARLDRVHFKEYGNFSLNYEIVYYVQMPDYNIYMDIQQAINLELYRRFDEEGIEFAYPTQTLFLHNELNGESKLVAGSYQPE